MPAAPHVIRIFGDPVLKTPCLPVTDIDDTIRRLVKDMTRTMYAAPGVGLAAPQVGVQKRLFVYDDGNGEGARTMINPELTLLGDDSHYEEGCLSLPGMYFSIVRPDRVHIKALDLDGNTVEFDADGFTGRILQHEVDHLDGMLLLGRLPTDERKAAMPKLREMLMRTR